MGSGELSDSNHLPRELAPSGNNTVEADDPGGDLVPNNVTDRLTNSTVDVTTVLPSSSSSSVETSSKAASPPVVIIPDKSSKPSYVIITDSEQAELTTTTTTHNMTVTNETAMKTSNTGAIVGVIVSLLVIGLIIAILVILMKKKRIKVPKKVSVKRKKMVTKMENPQYKGPGKDYRFSRDSTLHVGNTVNLTKFNNPNLADTPIPKVLQQQESPSTAKRSSLPKSIASLREKKRKAPPPPNPFGLEDDELYEKASHGSGEVELQTFAVHNENALEPVNTQNEQTYPLLKRSASSKEKNKPKDKNDNTNSAAEPKQASDDTTADPSESLLPKEKSASQDQISADVTLDDYDLTKNPFFTKT